MDKKNPIKQLMARWPRYEDFAADVGRSREVVAKWAFNGRIPSTDQAAVVHAAQSRGFEDVTADWMLRVHSAEKAAL